MSGDGREPEIPSYRSSFEIYTLHGKDVKRKNKANVPLSFPTPDRHNHSVANMDWCAGSLDESVSGVDPIASTHNVLFILGVQKGGTTWLFNALTSHPGFVGPEHAYMQRPGPWRKELHFFNRWPMPPPDAFLQCYPEHARMSGPTLDGRRTDIALLDGTPEYLFNSVSAPRIRQLVPQARFVVVLRGAELSWNECFKCSYSHVNKSECTMLPSKKRRAFEACGQHKSFTTLDVSNYAAQVAWWLNFFPPDRFLVLSSATLRRKGARLTLLNAIKAHAGLANLAPFTEETIANVTGFDGEYDTALTAPEQQAVSLLKAFFAPGIKELSQLLGEYDMDSHFEGITTEM